MVDYARFAEPLACLAQALLVVRQVVAAEIGQWGALSHAHNARLLRRRELNEPRLSGAIHPARRACRLLEMQGMWGYVDVEHHPKAMEVWGIS